MKYFFDDINQKKIIFEYLITFVLVLNKNINTLSEILIDKKIFKEVIVNADRKAVWDKWTTNEGIKSFFAPNCKVELRLNGPFEMYFMADAEPGGQGSEGCQFLSYLPYEMLSFTWNAPPIFPEIRNSNDHTWVVLHFEKITDTTTKVKLSHFGWRAGESWQGVYDYFDAAWTKVLENLSQSF